MEQRTDDAALAGVGSEEPEDQVASPSGQPEADDIPVVEDSGDAEPAAFALDVARLAEAITAEGAGTDELRLRHLIDLVSKGALDQEMYEAVVHGTVYFLDKEAPTTELLEEFRLRYKCDLQAFDGEAPLLGRVAERRPHAILLGVHAAAQDLAADADPERAVHAMAARGTRAPGTDVCGILRELLVASYGRDPVPVVLFTDDFSWLAAFEVLTYPSVVFVARQEGAEGLLTGLESVVCVERTEAVLRSGEAIREEIGLAKAQAIQQKLLPGGVPSVPGLEIAAYYAPCQEVGGDYYDFLPTPDGRLGVVCADVSGKGVSAAMVMVMFRSALRLAAQRGGAPSEIIAETNRLISKDMLHGMFVSALYLVIDPRTGLVELVNAGHMPVLHWPIDRVQPLEVPVRGMVVGMATGEAFEQATRQGELSVVPGEILCLYTDGIVEAATADLEEFGLERLIEAIRGAGLASPQEMVDHVVAAVADFCDGAPTRDDATLIVIKAQ